MVPFMLVLKSPTRICAAAGNARSKSQICAIHATREKHATLPPSTSQSPRTLQGVLF
jgi:hypothetical protein